MRPEEEGNRENGQVEDAGELTMKRGRMKSEGKDT